MLLLQQGMVALCGNMRILLVQPQGNVGKRLLETPSRALLILGTLAKQRGHDVRITHLDIDGIDWSWKPEIVGVTVNTFQVGSARDVARMAKNRGAKVIIGGPHAIVWDKKIDGNADKVVIGEGENSWLEFIGEKPFIKDINDIPIPDYALVNLDRFSGVEPVGVLPSLAIMASRGCPNQCTFCNTPVFWGKKVRYVQPQQVVAEVELLHNQYGVKEIFFQDDTFNINHKWAFEIFNLLIERGLSDKMLFKIACRVNESILTKEYLEKAKEAGVWNIFLGIESGSQYMLDRMKKGISIDEIKRGIQLCKDVGINTQCSFIVGLPGESMKTLQETDTLISEVKPAWHGWAFACPFPATEFDKEVTNLGHKIDMDYSEYSYGKVYARTDVLTVEELSAFRGFNYR